MTTPRRRRLPRPRTAGTPDHAVVGRIGSRHLPVAVIALGVSNVATNRWLPPAAYVPWNMAMSGAMLALARRAGCDAANLGIDPQHLARGLRGGGIGAAIVAAGYGALLTSGSGTDAFRDRRVTALPPGSALSYLALRIPLGTVVPEEVAFRAVLPALLSASRLPGWCSGAAASLLFGLWHVLPSMDLDRANAAVGRLVGDRGSEGAVSLAVTATSAAGVVLHALRRETGHLAAPVAVHLAANVLGFVGARLAGGER